MIALKNILVVTDFSAASDAALAEARRLATAFGSTLHLLHVVAEPLSDAWTGYAPAPQFLEIMDNLEDEARQRLGAMIPATAIEGGVVAITVRGDASYEILRYAAEQHVDLIVCGTNGRSGWEHVMMGSVAERLVRLAVCPVLTVHAAHVQAAAA